MMSAVLQERQKSILEVVIQEYIKTARPVASRDVIRRGWREASPATIRNEMHELDERGYLTQPHTSAGRIPTDRGYRFFVDHRKGESGPDTLVRRMVDRVFSLRDEERFMKELGKACAHLSGMFVAVSTDDRDGWYRSGLAELFEEPEFEDFDELRTFAQFVDALDDYRGRFNAMMNNKNMTLFIGEENPWEDLHHYSIACTPWRHPKGFEGSITFIGPTRMDYARVMSLMRYLYEY